MFRAIGSERGNLFISPYSIREAFAMTSAAAEGDCLSGITDSIRLNNPAGDIHAEFARVDGMLTRTSSNEGDTFAIANAVFLENRFRPAEDFIDLLKKHYKAQLWSFDAATPHGADEGVRAINDWCAERTGGFLEDVVPRGMLDRDSVMALINTACLKAVWRTEFNAEFTRDRDFHLLDGSVVRMPTMFQHARLRAGEDEEVLILSLPYRAGALEMLILLPGDPDGLPALEAGMSMDALNGWMSRMREMELEVLLPRWDMSASYDLIPALESLGMRAPFAPGGFTKDLGGDVFIGDVLHAVRIKVDERGTEAAAGTVAHFTKGLLSGDQAVIRVDHPFLFLIRDGATGLILFMGRVVDPR
jgi:serpin B